MARDVLLFPTSIHGRAIARKHWGLQQSLANEHLLGPGLYIYIYITPSSQERAPFCSQVAPVVENSLGRLLRV